MYEIQGISGHAFAGGAFGAHGVADTAVANTTVATDVNDACEICDDAMDSFCPSGWRFGLMTLFTCLFVLFCFKCNLS